MSIIGKYVKAERKKLGLTQEEFALRAGLGLRFVRDLEQGKETVRLDKVNQALQMFGMEAVPGKIRRDDAPGSRVFKLSAAYDMLPVNVILPSDKEQTALTVHGKKRNIRRKDFMFLADSCGISEKAAGNLMESVLRRKEKLEQICRQSQLSKIQREQVLTLMEERMKVLGQSQRK